MATSIGMCDCVSTPSKECLGKGQLGVACRTWGLLYSGKNICLVAD